MLPCHPPLACIHGKSDAQARMRLLARRYALMSTPMEHMSATVEHLTLHLRVASRRVAEI